MTARRSPRTRAQPVVEEPRFKRWDEYLAEAAVPDFELPVDNEKTIRIPAPTGDQVFEVSDALAEGHPKAILRAICGDAADDVLALVGNAPYGAMAGLIGALMDHFSLNEGESSASSS